jgi:hypothetical protein
METFTHYTDPSHGWVEVPRSLLHELGIADKITSYSYQRGEDVFLEEDCDLSTFDRAMEKAGRPFELVEVYEPRHRESWVRLLWSYEPEPMVSDEARSYGPAGAPR